VAFFEDHSQGITRWEVSRYNNIELLDGRATISYTVVVFDDAGRQTQTYDYQITLLREGDEWLWEEHCFPD
jgi:hypothetical protein